MATLTAWLAANWAGIVAAVIAAVVAYLEKDTIKAKLGIGPTVAADEADESTLDNVFSNLIARFQKLIDRLGAKSDAGKRTLHQFFLICIEDDVVALPDGPEKEEQLAAIATLAKYRVRSTVAETPVVVAKSR